MTLPARRRERSIIDRQVLENPASTLRILEAEDIGIAEGRGAVGVRRWPCNRIPIDELLTIRIDRGAIGRVAHIVPHRNDRAARGHHPVIVAEELGPEIVGA